MDLIQNFELEAPISPWQSLREDLCIVSLQRKGKRVMQTTFFGSSRTSRTWNIAAHFSPSAHGLLYDSNLQYSHEYIRDVLTSRLQHMQKHEITCTASLYFRLHILGNAPRLKFR